MEKEYLTVSIVNTCGRGARRPLKWPVVAALLAVLAAIAVFSASSQPGRDAGVHDGTWTAVTPVSELDTSATGRVVEILPAPEAYEREDMTATSVPFDVPDEDTGFKTYMDYRAISDRASAQYQLQQDAWTDEQGFRRLGERYMIALGTYYSKQCGAVFRITLDSGASFEAVVADVKADVDTDALHQHRDGNVVEFIVDTTVINRDCQVMGDMSWAGDMFRGRLDSIVYLGEI